MSLSGVKLSLAGLTTEIGVYALCDLDQVPIYVGQTTSSGERGINGRVRRHLTSARSDVIANRQIDPWEIAFVLTKACHFTEIDAVESQLYEFFCRQGSIVAGKRLQCSTPLQKLPQLQRVQLLADDEIAKRKDLRFRLPRQLQQISQLLDVMLNVKDSADLRFSLDAHFRRLDNLYRAFLNAETPDAEM
jgi:hypothetical protein